VNSQSFAAGPLNPPAAMLQAPVSGSVPESLGQYELRRQLAESATAQVWQGHDPRTGRDVRVKLFKPGSDLDAHALDQWVNEAHGRSHLLHPAIVPLLEVGVHAGQPFQVAPWVGGDSLDALMRAGAPVPQRRAVGWMRELLQALVLAHAAGIVHGRLHPGNILIDSEGHARLIDFAQSTRVADAASHAAHLQSMAAWQPVDPSDGSWSRAECDLHALGMVLARLLAAGDEAGRLASVADARNLALQHVGAQGRDVALWAVVHAAIATEPERRHRSAREFHARLTQWLAPSDRNGAVSVNAPAVSDEGTLERLLKRMEENEDFPAMTHAVLRIQAMVASDTESVGAVADEILKDVALSNKLLRIVNSAYYARGGGISSISRAVTLIGLNGVRNMAMGLVLLEGMQDKVHAQELTGEFLRALMAASIARELASETGDGEEVFIGAMFQELGRLLAMYYFPKEAQQVRHMLIAGAGKLTEHGASMQVLGLGYEALGLGVAKLWDLPADIRRYMHKPAGEPPARAAANTAEQIRWTTLAANALAETLLHAEPGAQRSRLDAVCKSYARAVGSAPDDMRDAMERARIRLRELAGLMGVKITAGSVAERLMRPMPREDAMDAAGTAASTAPALPALNAAIAAGWPPDDVLAAGLDDVDLALASGAGLAELLPMVVEAIFRCSGASHVLCCLRDAKGDTLSGRFGRGDAVEALVQGFHVPLATGSTDLFHAVCVRGADMLIADTHVARIAERLPPWYRKLVQPQAHSMLLLPMNLGEKPVALIYAHSQGDRALAFSERQMALLHRLRDRVQAALRQTPAPPR
jgi:eukaryotic-like serine/threonine-protein kinase